MELTPNFSNFGLNQSIIHQEWSETLNAQEIDTLEVEIKKI